AGGLQWRKPLLGHDALDILNDNNGIVHEDTDGQHHPEQGENVDGKVEGEHRAESDEKGDRDNNRGDERGADVLEKQKHHEEDQPDSFEKSLENFLDRNPDEGRSIERKINAHAWRKESGKVVDFLTHSLGGIQGVG